jgi:hypothetical protein
VAAAGSDCQCGRSSGWKINKKDLSTLRGSSTSPASSCGLAWANHPGAPDGSFIFGPNLSKIAQANDGYERCWRRNRDPRVRRAHHNFSRAIFLLYTNNRVSEAEHWFKILREKYPDALPPDQPVEEFVLKRMTETIGDVDHNRKKSLILGQMNGYFHSLILGETDRAAGHLRMARQIWEYYNSRVQARKDPGLDPFAEMYQSVLDDLLDPAGLPRNAARLRTALNLPVPAASPANAPVSRPTPKCPAQIFNLLYRRIAFCGPSTIEDAGAFPRSAD